MKTKTLKQHLDNAQRRLKYLTTFEGRGANPRDFVRLHASFIKTDLRRARAIIGV